MGEEGAIVDSDLQLAWRDLGRDGRGGGCVFLQGVYDILEVWFCLGGAWAAHGRVGGVAGHWTGHARRRTCRSKKKLGER